MNISIINNLSIIFVFLTVIANIASIIKHMSTNKKYYCAKSGAENTEFPSSKGFSNQDLKVAENFIGKFRGSVRLGNMNIYTDEEIEDMRIESKITLP